MTSKFVIVLSSQQKSLEKTSTPNHTTTTQEIFSRNGGAMQQATPCRLIKTKTREDDKLSLISG